MVQKSCFPVDMVDVPLFTTGLIHLFGGNRRIPVSSRQGHGVLLGLPTHLQRRIHPSIEELREILDVFFWNRNIKTADLLKKNTAEGNCNYWFIKKNTSTGFIIRTGN